MAASRLTSREVHAAGIYIMERPCGREAPAGVGPLEAWSPMTLRMGGRRQPDGMSEANLQRCHPRRGVLPSPRTEQVGMELRPIFFALPADY